MLKLLPLVLLAAGFANAAPHFEMQALDHAAIQSIERYTLQSQNKENIP